MENQENRQPLPLTNQKLWDIAKVIIEKQKAANDSEITFTDEHWDILEEDWFDWLEEQLFGEDD